MCRLEGWLFDPFPGHTAYRLEPVMVRRCPLAVGLVVWAVSVGSAPGQVGVEADTVTPAASAGVVPTGEGPAAQAWPGYPASVPAPLDLHTSAGVGRPRLAHPWGHHQDVLPAVPADECCFWADIEFIVWGTRGTSPPPLITTGPALPPGVAGAIGRPDTVTLFGEGGRLSGFRPGLRVEVGAWHDEHDDEAAFARFFFLGWAEGGRAVVAPGGLVVAVPQAVLGGTAPFYVGYPGGASGAAAASIQTNFLGADANFRGRLCDLGPCRLDLLAGFRSLQLGDALERSFAAAGDPAGAAGPLGPPPGGLVLGEDSLRTRNYFYGGQIGLETGKRVGAYSVQVRGLIALGGTVSYQDGSLTRTVVGGPDGVVTRTVVSSQTSIMFAAVPEVGVKFGWQPWDHVRFTAGYDWIYWSRVRRAADAYALGPGARNSGTDVWAQGAGVGLEVRY
jgi:hypothetical protein